MHRADLPKRSNHILQRFLLVLLLICFNVPCANPVSQDNVITLTLRVANYEDGPVQLLGLRHADESGGEPYVHFRNVSPLKTLHIWVQALVVASDQAGKILSRTSSNTPNLRWPDERMIESGADMWAHETVLRSDSIIVNRDKEVHVRCLSVTITVMSVEFVDGSEWMAGIKEPGKSLKFLDEPSNYEDACKNSTSSETGGHEVAGAMVRGMPQPEKLVKWEDKYSYSIYCPLVLREGKYYAACPF
jgi:hypothetical protein